MVFFKLKVFTFVAILWLISDVEKNSMMLHISSDSNARVTTRECESRRWEKESKSSSDSNARVDRRTVGARDGVYQKVEESRVVKLQSQPAYRQWLYLPKKNKESFTYFINLRRRKPIIFNNSIRIEISYIYMITLYKKLYKIIILWKIFIR